MKYFDETTEVPINPFGNLTAIAARLHKAFPEVAKFFPALSVGLLAGKPRRSVVDACTDRMSDARLDALLLEVDDLFSMGWTDERTFETVVCGIFGLDAAAVRRDSETVWGFVSTVEERLGSEHLARVSRGHNHTPANSGAPTRK